MPARRPVLLASACALAGALIPATAHAAAVQAIPVDAAGSGVVAATDGTVHVFGPSTASDLVLAADGARMRTVGLPAPVAASRAAAAGPSGRVWIAVDLAPGEPGLARVDRGGAVAAVPVGDIVSCPIVAVAAEAATGTVTFAAPPTVAGDCEPGLGTIWPDGRITSFADVDVWRARSLAYVGGKLFVGEAGTVRRYAEPGALKPESVVATGGTPVALALGADAQLYAATAGSTDLSRLPTDAPNASSAARVPAGVGAVTGLAANPVTNLGLVGSASALGTLSSGSAFARVELPADAGAAGVAALGEDTWVTAAARAEAYRVVDGKPSVRFAGDPGATTRFEVLPHGNATRWTLVARQGSTTRTATGEVGGEAGAVPQTADLGDLGTGAWGFRLTASNLRGESAAAFGAAGTPTSPPTTPGTRPPGKGVAPRFTTVLSADATRGCRPKPVVTLTVRKEHRGKVALITVRFRSRTSSFRGAALVKPVRLTGLPRRGRYTLRVGVTMLDGTTTSSTLTYRACTAKEKAKLKAKAKAKHKHNTKAKKKAKHPRRR